MGSPRRPYAGAAPFREGHAVKRHRGPQPGHACRDAPGHRSAEAEPDHAHAVTSRRGLRYRVREPALEILHVARGSRLAENARNRVEVVLGGPALAREQVHGEGYVTRFRRAPRDVLYMAG